MFPNSIDYIIVGKSRRVSILYKAFDTCFIRQSANFSTSLRILFNGNITTAVYAITSWYNFVVDKFENIIVNE